MKASRPQRAGQGGDLLFLPLGGSGEIGMNLNLYGYAGKWLMVDLGVTFGDEGVPGADVITPDPAFIEKHRDDLVALVLTHAHEDHLGAVPYLWPRLRCPVKIAIAPAATAGDSSTSPAATARSARSISTGPAPFSR